MMDERVALIPMWDEANAIVHSASDVSSEESALTDNIL